MERTMPTEKDIGCFWWARSKQTRQPILLGIAMRDGILVGEIHGVIDIPVDHPGIEWEGPLDPTWRILEAVEGKSGQQQILNK